MYNQLTREQRYAIYLGIQEGRTQTAIARQIGVHKSTVSRELKRNSNRQGKYWWSIAHERALDRRERTVRNRAAPAEVLREARRLLLSEEWSPKQISGYLSKNGVSLSHERIYEMIRADESGELKQHCRHRMKYRRHKKRKRPTKATNIPDRVSIHDRPAEADGKRFGDWEMDLILGKCQKSAILTLCERSRNYLIMERLPYVREEQELPYNGKAAVCQGPGESGGGGHQTAVAIQEECPDDNHGQRGRVPPAQDDSGVLENDGLLRRQLRPVAERHDREHQQADTAIHPEGD